MLTGEDLHCAVLAKKSTSGGLDGWGWNELKALPLSWYVGLAWILRLVEDTGVWPDGLLDACITMIPKTDGDSTPLGQRPLCVLPVIYRLWASVRLGHIQHWFHSWVPDTVFSAGKGVSSVDAWYATSMFIFLLRMLSSLSIRSTGVSLTVLLVDWVYLIGSGKFIFPTMLVSGFASNLLLGWGRFGPEMVVFRRNAL